MSKTVKQGGFDPFRRLMEAAKVLAIAQVRFPFVPEIQHPGSEPKIREVLGDAYPVMRANRTRDDVRTGERPPPNELHGLSWRLSDGSGESLWNVSLSPDSLSLESQALFDRKAFLGRLADVAAMVLKLFRPACANRVGLRFLAEVDADVAEGLISPEYLGTRRRHLAGPAPAGTGDGLLIHEESFTTRGGFSVREQWGNRPLVVAAGRAGADSEKWQGWTMDIDIYKFEEAEFDPEGVRHEAEGLVQDLEQLVGDMVEEPKAKPEAGRAGTGPDKDAPEDEPGSGTPKPHHKIAPAEAVREIRRMGDMSWEEVAVLLGVTRGTVHNWANGKKLTGKNRELVDLMWSTVEFLHERAKEHTRRLLFEVDPLWGQSRYDLLRRRYFEEAVSGMMDWDPSAERVPDKLEREDPELRSEVAAELEALNLEPGPLLALPPVEALSELRRLSGLKQSLVAKMLQVSPDSIEYWASEKPHTKEKLVLLYRMLAAVRHLYQGSYSDTIEKLTETEPSSGMTRYELLKAHRFDDAVSGVENVDNIAPRMKYDRNEYEFGKPPPIEAALGPELGPVRIIPPKRKPGDRRTLSTDYYRKLYKDGTVSYRTLYEDGTD